MRLQVKSGISTFLLMSFTIGYCDAITFVTSGFFSGHVLGNVIFSVYQLLHHNTTQGIVLLVSIPVYVMGLFIARQLLKYAPLKTSLFKTTGVMLMMTGGLSAILIIANVLNNQIVCFLIAFLIVVAMGIIGTSKYDLNIINNLVPGFGFKSRSFDNNDNMFIIICFIMGCALGAIAGNFVGLSGVMLPGVLLFLFSMND